MEWIYVCTTWHVKWKRIETQDWKIKNKCLRNVDLYFHIKFKYLFWYKFMTTSTALNMFGTIYKILNHRVSHAVFVERWMNKSEIDFSFHFHSSYAGRHVTKFWRYRLCYWHLCICCMTLRENILGNFITNHTWEI